MENHILPWCMLAVNLIASSHPQVFEMHPVKVMVLVVKIRFRRRDER